MLTRKVACIIALVIGCVQSKALAQQMFTEDTTTDPAHHFLWFKGHWSTTNKRQFIVDKTTAGSIGGGGGGSSSKGDGGTVTVTPDGQVQSNSQGSDDWNKKIDDGLNNIKKYEDELDENKNSNEWQYHFFAIVNPEVKNIKQTLEANKIDQKVDVLNQDGKQDDPASAIQKFARNLDQGCQKLKAKYDAVIDFYKAHKSDDESSYNNPVPPEFEAECVSCDSAKRGMAHEKADHYVEKFFQPEQDLTRDALSVLREAFFLGQGSDIDGAPSNTYMQDDMRETVSNAFSKKKNGACSFYDDYQLHKAILFLMNRMYLRARKLLKDYKDNVKTGEAVIKTVMAATRNCSLMGMQTGGDEFAVCKPLLKKVLDYYANKLLIEHDWSQLGNIPFIFNCAMNYEIFGGEDTHILEHVSELLRGFRLQIELNSEIGVQQGNAVAHLKGEAKIAPEFKYDQDSCYRWVVVEGESAGLPLKKQDQKIECDLLVNEIHAPQMSPIYVGTKKYAVILEGLKMNFCYPGEDSIFLTTFIAQPNIEAGNWTVKEDPKPHPWGINGTDAIFCDISKMKEMSKSGKAKAQAENMKQEKEKMIDEIRKAEQQMNMPGQNRMTGYQKILNISTHAKSLGEDAVPVQYIDFQLDIQNKNKTLFDKSFNAKDINPEASKAIVYATYKVKIIYKGP